MNRRQFRLSDGRPLHWLDLGNADGVPTIYLHGTPSSAREASWLDRDARDRGVRLIAPDRPGYLDSRARSGAQLGDVARDLLELADGLGCGLFAAAGFSGGSAFALALAAASPDRVTTVIVGGGMGALGSAPGNPLPRLARILFATAAWNPRLGRTVVAVPMWWVAHQFARELADPRKGASSMLRGAANGTQVEAVDAYIASRSDAELRAELSDRVRGFRSLDGIVSDLATYAGDLAIDLSALTMPVEIWHGQADPAVPVAFAEALAAALPKPRLHVCEGEGHMVFLSHTREVLEAIASSFPPK